MKAKETYAAIPLHEFFVMRDNVASLTTMFNVIVGKLTEAEARTMKAAVVQLQDNVSKVTIRTDVVP